MPRLASFFVLMATSTLALAVVACSGPNTGTMDSGGSCPSGQHACTCATGQYCVAGGAMCVSPTAACPGTDGGGVHDAGMVTDGGDARNDTATDTGMMTDGATDTGTTMDTGATTDAATDTGTILDTGVVDTGVVDTGTILDTGVVDTGTILDTGVVDTGLVDTGVTDTGNVDTGIVDTGVPMCPPMQHVCLCATGYYCLRIGFTCLAPGAPCPP